MAWLRAAVALGTTPSGLGRVRRNGMASRYHCDTLWLLFPFLFFYLILIGEAGCPRASYHVGIARCDSNEVPQSTWPLDLALIDLAFIACDSPSLDINST